MAADPKWYEKFTIVRGALIDDKLAPYLAPIALRCTPVPVPDMGTDIACDEAGRIYYDAAYAVRVASPTFAADVAHEIAGHLFSDHHARKREHGATDHDLWGLSTDASLNDGTIAHLAAAHPKAIQPGGQIFRSPEDPQARKASNWVWPESLKLPPGGTAETYYDALVQRKAQQQQQQQQQGQSQPQQGQGQPQAGQGQGQGQGQKAQPIGAGQPQAGQGSDGPVALPPRSRVGSGTCGSCAGEGSSRMDEIKAKAEAVHGTLPGGIPEEERESLRQEVAQAVVAHANAKGQGSVPAGLLLACTALLKPPKVKWEKRIAALVRQGVAGAARGSTDWAMRRPRWKHGIGFPRLTTPQARVAVVADTSGSMGESDLVRVLSEVKSLIDCPAVERLWWIPTDAKADKVIRARDIAHARNNLIGGGGTNMGEGLDTVSTKCRPSPHLTLVITDGMTSWPKDRPKRIGRTIIVLTQPSTMPRPSWAITVEAF